MRKRERERERKCVCVCVSLEDHSGTHSAMLAEISIIVDLFSPQILSFVIYALIEAIAVIVMVCYCILSLLWQMVSNNFKALKLSET